MRTKWSKKNKQTKKRANPCWKDIVKENESMEKYYKEQHIVSDEEWDTFLKFCRKDLPSTFRITKIRGHAKDLLRSLREGYISKLTTEDMRISADSSSEHVGGSEEGEESEQDLLLEPIKWYPNDLAWNSNLSRRFIRRSEILQKLHRFLVEDSECGAITRQEAVSMIPPMLLDVKSHHLVLDMCAAPGSKTAQIIEMMHENDQHEIPTGAVIANDADHKRCYMLTHQSNRLNTPCVIITNHDAAIFPKLYSEQREEGGGKLLEFDRVLCDVPCSGDGTIRKNPLMWKKWTPHLGVALHRLQMRILIRGLEMLKTGGKLVYSTCSFNPIENEAVLATVLGKCEGTVELLDCSNELEGLIRRPGMTTWKVFAKNGDEYKSFAEMNCKPADGYKESMFPPTEDVSKSLNLQRCMRIYPHLQNTGGFFIAVLEKQAELPWQKAKRSRHYKGLPWEGLSVPNSADASNSTSTCDDENVSNGNEQDNVSVSAVEVKISNNKSEPANRGESPPRKKFRRGCIKEDPYIFLDDSDQDLANVRRFYDLSADLPSKQFLVRNAEGKKRHIYLVSENIHKVINENKNLKIINTGLRVISRSQFKAGVSEHGLQYRLVQDGVHLVSRFIKKRIVSISHSDLITLISAGETEIENLEESTRAQLACFDMGSVLWYYNVNKLESTVNKLTSDIWLCGHYGTKIVQCMLSKEEKKHFLRLLGVPIPAEMEVKVKGPSWGDSNLVSNVEEETTNDEKKIIEIVQDKEL